MFAEGSAAPTVSKHGSALVVSMLVLLLAGAAPACAQDWPTRPIKVIVPYGPGGVSDTMARLTADRLSKALDQPVVIENKSGAGGSIGTEAAVRSPNDGYTLLFASASQLTVVPLTQKLKFDPVAGLTPISIVGENPMAIAVHPSLPVKSIPELIAHARANPGKVDYGTAGLGTNSHLTGAAFAAKLGLQLVPVPYKSATPAVTGLLAGEVPLYFGNTSDTLAHAKAGTVRVLAVTTPQRLPQFPDIPTVAESVPGFSWVSFNALFAPAGTPKPIVDKLARLVMEICRDPDFAQRLASLGVDAKSATPEETAAAVQEDLQRSAMAVDAAGIRQN
jgi:tripartite-type tricarboxylate transporter receptor subunit TctC